VIELNKVHQGDCLELMKQIEDKSVDMILCDLPYGMTALKWDSIIPLDKLWLEYRRIAKDDCAIVLTASQPFTSMLVTSALDIFKHEWIWEKQKASNFMSFKYQPAKYHENVLVFCKGKIKYFPIMWRVAEELRDKRKNVNNVIMPKESHYGFMDVKIRKADDGSRYPKSILKIDKSINKNVHPTEKPVPLFEYLIKTYSKEGNLVLDNCIGSGTTAIACKKNNRNFIGIELEQKYVDICNSRLREIQVPLDVNKKEVAIPPKDKSSGILANDL
jgi:site-specific DNA-methyltransferase (adenine-specific)